MDSKDAFARVLILAPTRKDGDVTAALLDKAGVDCLLCGHVQQLASELRLGAGAILLTEEVISAEGILHLLEALSAQPTWSNVPIVMLMKGGVTSPEARAVLPSLRNVTLLERPAATRSVVSAVQAALRGRAWQYRIRDQLAEIQAGQNERQQLLESEQAARKESERASQIKDEFLATLSHELRTPLNAILGWAQIIKMNPRNEETVLEGVKVIDRNVRVQTELIEDLLDMSRIVSGKVRLELQRVSLVELLEGALESVRPALSAKEIHLEKSMEPAVGTVSADPGRLQQVFWNLLTNAVKFTPKGGTIRVLAKREQSQLEVSVTDTGSGIAPEFLPQLFERFSQADSSTTRSHGGLGLGLSIVRHLAEMHGGTVSASSQGLGQGATFVVRLPVDANQANVQMPISDAKARSAVEPICNPALLKGLKVLVVDDEADAREMVRRFLVQCGATPALATSAAEANSVLPMFAPHVIVSDIGMPTQDGYAFMQAVRESGLRTPALALTAFARPEDQARSIQAGFQMHLPKPVDPAKLIAAVASLAGR